MKKCLLSLVAVLTVCLLLGCNNRADAPEPVLKPMPQNYQGILPCTEGCQGVQAQLFLGRDGHYVLEQRQLEDPTLRFAEYGEWKRTADKLTLTKRGGEKRVFRPTEDRLELMRKPGVNDEPYVLKPMMPVDG